MDSTIYAFSLKQNCIRIDEPLSIILEHLVNDVTILVN
jgi:hypothetical protein